MRHDPPVPPGSNQPDPDLLDRYLAGECSVAEGSAVEAWLTKHPDEATRLGAIAYVAKYPISGLRREAGKDAAFAAFLAKIRADGVTERIPLKVTRTAVPRWAPQRRSTSRTMLAAAVMLSIVGAGTWQYMRNRAAGTANATATVAWTTYTSPKGQQTTVRLADGTRITLAAESELRVRQAPKGTGSEIVREVALSGEGFFEVAHVADHPFSIHTPHGTVTQLGTAFDVRAYDGESATRVAVAEGRVSLRPGVAAMVRQMDTALSHTAPAAADAVVLAAGDYAVMTSGRVQDVARGIDVSQYSAWRRRELRFTNAPLRDVVAEIERWYDVKIELGDPAFAEYELTATLRSGSVDDVMDVVVKSLDLRANRKGHTVWIVGKKGQPTKNP